MNIKRDYDQPSQPSQPDYGRQSSGSYGHQASEYDRQPSTNYGRQTSDYGGGRDFGRQSSHGYQPSPQPAPHTPTYTPQSPSAYYGNQQPAYTPPSPAAPVTHKPIPDAILNMAAKGDPNRKPFTYTPDADVIKEQRDRVRRKPGGAMPRYQQMLNMPQFDDSVLTPKSPQTPPQVAPQSPTYDAGPGDATVQHLQYNSPMGLYSNNNMAEAFEGQTDGVVTGASGVKTDQNKDITQSPVYRMIHGLDANKPKSRPAPPAEAQYRPVQDDEMTFSGIGHKNDVPSRSFQKLQNMTSGSEVDTSSIRGNVTGGTDDEVSDYDQASIRYTGRNIPSKSFRMLQSMTGDDPSSLGVPGQQRRQRRKPQAPPSPDQDPDDVVDIRYVGGSIPSQAFRALQHLTGDDQTTADDQTVQHDDVTQEEEERNDTDFSDIYMGKDNPSRSFQLIHSAYGDDDRQAIATERRRKRRRDVVRQNSAAEEDVTSQQEDAFDENAYLAGHISLKVSSDEKPAVAPPAPAQKAAWQKTGSPEPDDQGSRDFDENAYLEGRIPIFGDTPVHPKDMPVPESGDPEQPEAGTESGDFDEDEYLAGRLNYLGGDTKSFLPKEKPRAALPDWARKRKQKMHKSMNDLQDTDDYEDKYLGISKQETPRHAEEDPPPTYSGPFDEDAFLAGELAVLGGAFDPATTVPRAPAVSNDVRATWQMSQTPDEQPADDFDEDDYLRGKVNIVSSSVDRELPPREHDKPRMYREPAPWERADDPPEGGEDQEGEFSEGRYLAGRVATVRRSVDRDTGSPGSDTAEGQFAKVPSRTFHYLRRSMSRDESPPGRRASRDQAEEEEDPNKAYQEMMYVGKKIPSRAFLRLEQSMARRAQQAADPLDHLKDEVMDVDTAMEKLDIDTHDPDEYLEKLKESVQANTNIKIEAEGDEVTDF